MRDFRACTNVDGKDPIEERFVKLGRRDYLGDNWGGISSTSGET